MTIPLAKQIDPAAKAAAPGQHVAYLDGIRALAALFVVLHHSYFQVNFQADDLPKWLSRVLSVFAYGHYSVDVFIVLSGFCLALPVVRGKGQSAGGAATFFRKRARRILPPYFCAFAFSWLLIWIAIGKKTGTFWDISLPVTEISVLAHLILVQDMFQATSAKINYAFWSISVEWRIYFLFPLLMGLRRRWNSVWVAAACVLAAYAVLIVGKHLFHSVLNFNVGGISPQYLGLFVLGLLGADVAYGGEAPWLRRSPAALMALGVSTGLMIAVSAVPILHGHLLPPSFCDFFVGVWAVCLLVAASNTQIAWLNRLLSWRPLVFVGTFAYSIYLIHAPLIQVLWQYVLFPLRPHPLLMFGGLCLIGLPLIVGCSYLFFLLCERPFLNKRRRETFAETERDAAVSPAP